MPLEGGRGGEGEVLLTFSEPPFPNDQVRFAPTPLHSFVRPNPKPHVPQIPGHVAIIRKYKAQGDVQVFVLSNQWEQGLVLGELVTVRVSQTHFIFLFTQTPPQFWTRRGQTGRNGGGDHCR